MAAAARTTGYFSGTVQVTQWERYVGLPFKNFGRDFDGVDCWGLVRLVLKTECNLDLPTYGEISAHDLMRVTDTIREESSCEPWIPVDREYVKAFDVALLVGRPLHVGILVSSELLMHVEDKICTVLLPLTHPSIDRRIIGFRRHQAFL